MYEHLFQGTQRLSLIILQVLAPNPCRQGCASCGTTWQREDFWVPAACCTKAPVRKPGLTILHGASFCANTVGLALVLSALQQMCSLQLCHGRNIRPQKATCAGAHIAAIVVLQGASLPQLGMRQQSICMCKAGMWQTTGCVCMTQGAGSAGCRQLLQPAQAVQAEGGLRCGRQRQGSAAAEPGREAGHHCGHAWPPS